MLFRGKAIDEVTEDDLRELISSQQPEHRTLEYKLELPGGSDKDKREFLADVSSFANTSGGYIVYGIGEEQGAAAELRGCAGSADKHILRLESSIRTGIAPRISGVQARAVPLGEENWALVLQIPKSLAGPHMVCSEP